MNTYCLSTAKMVARTRLNVKLLHTLPVWLSNHYAYSSVLVNQFAAQNNINMQILLQSVLFQSNHIRTSDIVFNTNMHFPWADKSNQHFHHFRQNTEQNYLNLTTHNTTSLSLLHFKILTLTSIGRQIAIFKFYLESINPNSAALTSIRP
jgi:hypothetical protein